MLRVREPVNGYTHLISAIVAIPAIVYLLSLNQGDTLRVAAVLIYGMCMVLVFLSSAAFHMVTGPDRLVFWLHRIDHATIYLMIAGAYTALCGLALQGEWRWYFLTLIWGMAFAGILYKMLFLVKPGWFSLIYYLSFAALGLFAPPEVFAQIPPQALNYIWAGGAVIVVGTVIFGLERPKLHPQFGYHEIWHLFVMLGTALHFVALLQCCV
jgi:hemolysin III